MADVFLKIVGVLSGLIWLGVLVALIGFYCGFWSHPEIGDGLLFSACCFGISSGFRMVSL